MPRTRKSATAIIRCAVCRKKYPRPFMNEHHRQPKEAGGCDTTDNLVMLCAGCHQTLHRLVEQVMRGDGGVAADYAATLYPHPRIRQTMLGLARDAAYYLLQLQELGVVKTALTAKTVSVELSGAVYQQLKVLAGQTRDARGMTLSVPGYLKALVRRHLLNPLF